MLVGQTGAIFLGTNKVGIASFFKMRVFAHISEEQLHFLYLFQNKPPQNDHYISLHYLSDYVLNLMH
jgi:hypothetical protein